MSNKDYPEEIRVYARIGNPFKVTDRRNYNHWYYYNVVKPKRAKKAIVKGV